MPAEVGQPAPDFSLYDTDRNVRTLAEFRGKNRRPRLLPRRLHRRLHHRSLRPARLRGRPEPDDAQVVGVTVDPPFAQKAWADANEVNYPFLSDFNRQAVNAYGVALPNLAGMEGYVAANRAVFVIDADGNIQYRWDAPAPVNEPDYAEVRSAVQALAG